MKPISTSLARADTRELMRLKLGASKLLGCSMKRVEVDCYHCGAQGALSRDNHAVRHMLQCKATAKMREEILGTDDHVDSNHLWTEPNKCIKYARAFWSAAPHAVRPGTRQAVPMMN